MENTLPTTEQLHEEINAAYAELHATAEDLARADRELSEHVTRVRVENADALLEAKNERTAAIYLEGLLDTEDHRNLSRAREGAELAHQRAKREVERLHLLVRLLSAPVRGAGV
jgi:hypothetical protein